MWEPRGAPIPRSKLYRDYCLHCKEPMRVALLPDGKMPPPGYCRNCDGHKPPPLAANRPEGQGHGLGKTSS